ncbi:MAG: tetratricopeptide repeat protein [Thermoanaerobaculia bacterium]
MAPLPGFSTREVARLLRVTQSRVRSLVYAGFVTPGRGPGRRYRFSFQDVVVLRAARDLVASRIPASRITRIVDRLRAELPGGRSLASLRIAADGAQVVVRNGGESWEPESGQLLLDFTVADLVVRAVPLARKAAAAAHARSAEMTAEEWFALGYELEATELEEAVRAYSEAVKLDPEHADAHVNLGRLLHERGAVAAAADHYRKAAALRPGDATAAYDLGVALQDLGRFEEAAEVYGAALEDTYYNLSAVCERLGREALAIRHLKTYRQLVTDR